MIKVPYFIKASLEMHFLITYKYFISQQEGHVGPSSVTWHRAIGVQNFNIAIYGNLVMAPESHVFFRYQHGFSNLGRQSPIDYFWHIVLKSGYWHIETMFHVFYNGLTRKLVQPITGMFFLTIKQVKV